MDNVRTAPKKVQKKLHKTHGGVNLKKESNSKLKIIPLGGLEQIGMNITAFEYEDSIIELIADYHSLRTICWE